MSHFINILGDLDCAADGDKDEEPYDQPLGIYKVSSTGTGYNKACWNCSVGQFKTRQMKRIGMRGQEEQSYLRSNSYSSK